MRYFLHWHICKEIVPWQGDFALAKETLLLPKKPCSWQGDFALGKESETLTPHIFFSKIGTPTKVSLLLPKRLLPWQGDFALAKETLLLARRFCSCQRNFALAKEILLLTIKMKGGRAALNENDGNRSLASSSI